MPAPSPGPKYWLSRQDNQRRHWNYNEHWLERMVQGVYRNVIDEPVPRQLLDIVKRVPL
jgi:hypothetical protein